MFHSFGCMGIPSCFFRHNSGARVCQSAFAPSFINIFIWNTTASKKINSRGRTHRKVCSEFVKSSSINSMKYFIFVTYKTHPMST